MRTRCGIRRTITREGASSTLEQDRVWDRPACIDERSPDMLALMRQIHRLLLNLLKLAREVRGLACAWFNLLATRQARYFA